jgi:copper chaperone NosL
MMKKAAPILASVLLMAIVAVVIVSVDRRQGYVTIHTGNTERRPVPMEPNRYQDTQCAMLIEDIDQAAQAVDARGRTWFFDDVGCLALWLEDRRDDDLVLWVRTRDTGEWIDARRAWYSRDSQTIMEYGFAPHESALTGFVDFDTMVRMMFRGENLTNPYVRKALLVGD